MAPVLAQHAGNNSFFADRDSQTSNTTGAIDRYRKRDVQIILTDASGKPLRERQIEVKMIRHAFPFGDCNVGMDSLFRKGYTEKLSIYRQVFSSVLNAVNATCYWSERPRNNLAKTEPFQGEYNVEGFADTVDWGNANGLIVKGHPLFWTVPKAIPEWLSRYDYETQLKFAEVRLRNLVSRFRGKVVLWDAVNEMLWEPALKNLPKRQWPYLETYENMAEYISFVLRICREEDPSATFLINDYGLERDHKTKLQLSANDNDPGAANDAGLRAQDGSAVTARLQRKRYLELVKRLKESGFTPSAIGLQGHSGALTREQQAELYDEMATSGLPVHITEFWAKPEEFGDTTANMPPAEQHEFVADYVEKFLANAFAHPAVEAFYFWGFMGMATHWPDPTSPAYEEKPVLNRLRKLLHETWTTRETLTTNGDGVLKIRAFYGDYEMLYSVRGSERSKTGIPFTVNRYQGMPLKFSLNI